jgi:sulfane dehydrogenase subunit SoxC
VTGVEVSTDGGETWSAAALEAPLGPFAWRRWTFEWDAVPGDHVLCVRATDASGAVQPMQPPWNAQGMANNAVQRVPVHVR